MSLRARLLAGLVLVLVALVGAGVSVSLVQRDYLYGQLDELLMAGASNFDHMTGPNGGPLLGPGFRGGRHSRIPGDVFVGFVSANGSVTAVPEMQADAALAPELASDTAIANPTTLPTRADDSKNVRVVTAKLRSGVTMVFAVSTTSADQTLRKLVVTLLIGGLAVLAVVALVVWWVIRLGLRPIRRMTEAADAIAGGAVDRRVEGTEGRTEAATRTCAQRNDRYEPSFTRSPEDVCSGCFARAADAVDNAARLHRLVQRGRLSRRRCARRCDAAYESRSESHVSNR